MKFAAIFDMDGVLINNHQVIWDAHNAVLGVHGVHIGEDEIQQYSGMSLRDQVEGWNKRYGLHMNLEDFTRDTWKIQIKGLRGIGASPDLVRLLDDLSFYQTPMGIGTSSPKFRAEEILNILQIKEYFSEVVTSNDVKLHKPSPDVFLEVARRLQMSPAKCVVFEDAGNGIRAARIGGMKTIGYLNGYNRIEDLKGSNLVIRSFSEVDYGKIERLFK